MALRYLTPQDVLWINLQVTRRVLKFEWVGLEEAVNAQFGYGSSQDVVGQASTFVTCFLRKAPFEFGNEGTALVALATFLRLNGLRLTVEDGSAVEWIRAVGSDAVRAAVTADFSDAIEHVDDRSVQQVATLSLERYAKAIEELGTPPFRPTPIEHGFRGQETWTGPGNVRDYLG
ncbi:MAG: hypothetical protein KIS66_06510 [Fimbriimonadaceae bacterium]|nr:hypothetical protein [Fimbriimonadaceae bacterium]